MGRILLVLGILAIIGALGYAVVALVNRSRDSQVVRRRDLKQARRHALAAENALNEVQRLALTNLEFQPHLAAVILTTVQEYNDEKRKELA